MNLESNHMFLSEQYSQGNITAFQYVTNMFVFADFEQVDIQSLSEIMHSLSSDDLARLWCTLEVHRKYERTAILLLLSFGVYPKTELMISNAIWALNTAKIGEVTQLKTVRDQHVDVLSKLIPSEVPQQMDGNSSVLLSRAGDINGIGFENVLFPSYIDLTLTSKNLASLMLRRTANSVLCESADFNRLLYGCTVIYRMLHPEIAQSNPQVFSLVDVHSPLAGQAVYLTNTHNQSGFDRLLTLFLDELSKMGCAPRQSFGTQVYVGFHELDTETGELLSMLTGVDWRWIKVKFRNILSAYDPYGLFELIDSAIIAAQNGEAIESRVLADAALTRVQWD